MTPHLTHEQLCDLLLARSSDTSHEAGRLELLREHLRNCPLCASELASLNESLAVFRSTATAWANHELANQQVGPRTRVQLAALSRTALSSRTWVPALWTAAAALVVAATLPLIVHRNPVAAPKTPAPAVVVTQPNSSQSDEALLDEINETLSSSIPSPMQPLDDPTAGRNSQSNNTQRKN